MVAEERFREENDVYDPTEADIRRNDIEKIMNSEKAKKWPNDLFVQVIRTKRSRL